MQFEFTKIHGTGNDFIVVDNRKNAYTDWSPPRVRGLCAFHTGIGADGLLLLEHSQQADFRMRFFNSDGYESQMCVNGSRCICYFAYSLGIVSEKFVFEAGDGLHNAKIIGKNRVRVQVNLIASRDDHGFPQDFTLPGDIVFETAMNTGVPHIVLMCRDVDAVPVHSIGKSLRFHPVYQPEGRNVNFVQIDINSRVSAALKIRTFERGVDAETLSCGSGATAAAIACRNRMPGPKNEVTVVTRGGALKVLFENNTNNINLEGPVEFVFQGHFLKEDVQ